MYTSQDLLLLLKMSSLSGDDLVKMIQTQIDEDRLTNDGFEAQVTGDLLNAQSVCIQLIEDAKLAYEAEVRRVREVYEQARNRARFLQIRVIQNRRELGQRQRKLDEISQIQPNLSPVTTQRCVEIITIDT